MNTRLFFTKIVGATALLPLVVLTANADTLLTFERETSGSMQMGFRRGGDRNNGAGDATQTAPAVNAAKQAVTVMMKGAKARVEFRPAGAAATTAPTKVLLYDTNAQKVYTLDPAAKTYYAQTYKEALEGERDTTNTNGQQGGMASRMTFNGDMDIKAARENSAYVTKDIDGTTAKRYDISGSVSMSFNGNGGPAGAGGFGGRGGRGGGNNNQYNSPYQGGGTSQGNFNYQPQGGYNQYQGGVIVNRGGQQNPQVFVRPQQGQQGQRPQFTPPSFTISGQVWLTPNLPLGSTRDIPAAAIYQLMLPDNTGPIGATLIKTFVAKMNSLKTVPSESTVGMGMQFNNQNAQTPDIPPFSTHLTLKSQQSNATLEDGLFVLPTDYKEVEVPRQGFGGRNRGDRGQGGQGRGFGRRGNGGNGEQQ